MVYTFQVYDTSSENAASFQGEFSGTSTPSPVHSSDGTMFVKFVTDGVRTKSGWRAIYSYG